VSAAANQRDGTRSIGVGAGRNMFAHIAPVRRSQGAFTAVLRPPTMSERVGRAGGSTPPTGKPTRRAARDDGRANSSEIAPAGVVPPDSLRGW
jgi:hypothetical protein